MNRDGMKSIILELERNYLKGSRRSIRELQMEVEKLDIFIAEQKRELKRVEKELFKLSIKK